MKNSQMLTEMVEKTICNAAEYLSEKEYIKLLSKVNRFIFLEMQDMGTAPEYATAGWTYCKDKLPEKSGYYICDTGISVKGLDYSEKFEKFNATDASMEYAMDVIAWMPFPEPAEAQNE